MSEDQKENKTPQEELAVAQERIKVLEEWILNNALHRMNCEFVRPGECSCGLSKIYNSIPNRPEPTGKITLPWD